MIGWWRHGTVSEPRGAGLERVLKVIAAPHEPYRLYLERRGSSALAWCPSGHEWKMPRAQLPEVRKRYRKMGRSLRRDSKGRHLVECRPCSYRRRAPAMVKQLREGLLIHRLGREEAARRGIDQAGEKDIKRLGRGIAKALRVKADAGDTKSKEKLLAAIRPGGNLVRLGLGGQLGPRTDAQNQRASETKIATILLRSPLRRCELCTLLVHNHRFHRRCYVVFARWRGRHGLSGLSRNDRPPHFGDPRGRKVTPEILARNYGWLMAREISRRRTGRAATRRSLYSGKTQTTVNEAIRSFVALLPGDWDLVFWPRPKSKANETRQRVVPLPDVLQELIDAGARDELILRLHGFGMPDEEIVQLVGNLARVRGVLARATSTESAST